MKIVKVNFLGKEYDIKCKEDEVAKIKNLELRLNNRVRQFSKKNQNFTDTHKLLIATLSLEDQVNDLLHSKKILQSNLDDLEKERKILLENHSIDYEDIKKNLESVSIKIKVILKKILEDYEK